jgi:nicotinamidase-related amidase
MTNQPENQAQTTDKTFPALLVIDVQRALFERPNPIYQAEQLLANINALIDGAREASVPLYYIQHANERTLVEGTDGWRLHPGLRPPAGEPVIHKRQGNAFIGTSLGDELASQGVTELVVTGLVTQGCVRATCLGGLELGYRVTLVRDGHSNWNKGAARLIREWNRKLSDLGVSLKAAAELEFYRG